MWAVHFLTTSCSYGGRLGIAGGMGWSKKGIRLRAQQFPQLRQGGDAASAQKLTQPVGGEHCGTHNAISSLWVVR
jgi:hypothetical protein